jgi:hypothetical protein
VVIENETSEISHTPSVDTNSPETWKLIRTWLKNCAEKHTKGDPEFEKFFPDRVLDVGIAGDSEVFLRVLHDLPQEQQTSRYLTLSHCWGATQILKVTRSTLSKFQSGIEVSILPKTFQDAVEATRQLGERYIWIDSLCIIQDSLSDWEEQSSKMDKIYMNGYCNLAATASSDSTGGLFHHRNLAAIQQLQVPCKWDLQREDGNFNRVDFHQFQRQEGSSFDERMRGLAKERFIVGQCQVMDYSRLHRTVVNAPLNSRGWVFQERLLSLRVVHFGAEQIVWECEHVKACETYPDTANKGPPNAALSTHFLDMKNFATELRKVRPGQVDRAALGRKHGRDYASWRTVVELYSRLKLTFATDVLVALGGLAQVMKNAVGDEYLAGLWRDDIAHQMLWERIGTTDLKGISTCEKFIAPSWSWASTGYVVMWDPCQIFAIDTHLEYLGCSIISSGDRTSRQLENVALRLKARIFTIPCTANKHFGRAPQPLVSSDAAPDTLIIDSYPKRPPKDNLIEIFIKGLMCPAWITFDNPEKENSFFGFQRDYPILFDELTFMPTAFCPIDAYGQRLYGIILQEDDDSHNNVYRRMGRLEIQLKKEIFTKILKDSDDGVGIPFTPDLSPYYFMKIHLEAQQNGWVDTSVGFHGADDGKEREITLV